MDYGRIFFNCNKFSFGVRHVTARMRCPRDGEGLAKKIFRAPRFARRCRLGSRHASYCGMVAIVSRSYRKLGSKAVKE